MSKRPEYGWKAGLPRRAAAYLLGIAIGLVLLGVVQSKLAERAKANKQRAESDPGDSPAAAPDPTPKDD